MSAQTQTAQAAQAGSTPAATPSPVVNQSVFGSSVFGPFGWRTLDGRVIQVEPIYLATPDFRWGRFLIKLGLIGATAYYYGLIILLVLGALLVLAWLVSKILPLGFLSAIAVQVISFMLTRRLVGPIANVPVRDIRVRDSSGQETLVRMKGQLTSGSVSVGDDVLLEGWERNGTLLFRKGYNKRIRSDIRIKPQ